MIVDLTPMFCANAVRLNISLSDAIDLSQLEVHLVQVKPGKDTTEYHLHLYEDECVYILAGKGTVIIEGDCYPVGPGFSLVFHVTLRLTIL